MEEEHDTQTARWTRMMKRWKGTLLQDRTMVSIGIVIGFVLLSVPFVTSGSYLPSFLLGMYVFMTLAIGFNIIAGYAGQFSLGHVLFYGIGGYAGAISVLNFGIPWTTGVLVAGAVGIAVAIPIGYITLRLHGLFFAFATLAVAEMFRFLFLGWSYVNAAGGLSMSPQKLNFSMPKFYIAAFIVLILGLLLQVFLDRSLFGTRLQALRDDEMKAESVGINTWYYKNLAFILSAVFPAMAGAIHTYFLLFISPADAFDPVISITMQLMVILGGLGTILGPIIGGVIFYSLRETASFTFPQLHFLVTGAVLIVMIIYMPEGIVGWIKDRL